MEKPVNVRDYEALAKHKLEKSIYDYYACGANDELALRRNETACAKILLIPRILQGLDSVNTGVKFFDHSLSTPIFIAPTAFHATAHSQAEIATVRAANYHRIGMIASTMSTTSLEEIAAISNGLLWFQLYIYKDRSITERLIDRAERAGYQAIMITADVPIMGKRERDIRNNFKLPARMVAKNFLPDQLEHISSTQPGSQVKNYTDQLFDATFSWKDLAWIRSLTKLPIIIKGVMHEDDAEKAAIHGVDAIVVSNHGGRQLDAAPASIEVLPGIVKRLKGKLPILIDGGFRRGSDIFKAIALGANAVLIGRPVLWALALNGEEALNELFTIYCQELKDTMIFCGCATIEEIQKNSEKLILFA